MTFLERLRRHSEPSVDWESIYRRLYPRLYNFFRFRSGCSHLAEELTAEVFERAWRDRERFRQDLGRFESWIFGIARHVAVDDQRRRQRLQKPVDLDRIAERLSLPEQEQPASVLERRDDLSRLYVLLTDLEPRAQELLALKYGGGLNNRQIAAMTALSESNVGTILHRTVVKLRQAWGDTDHE